MALIAFLERFQQYQNLGGTIELRQCLDPVILQMIVMVDATCVYVCVCERERESMGVSKTHTYDTRLYFPFLGSHRSVVFTTSTPSLLTSHLPTHTSPLPTYKWCVTTPSFFLRSLLFSFFLFLSRRLSMSAVYVFLSCLRTNRQTIHPPTHPSATTRYCAPYYGHNTPND
jgi:hypothetical protein